MVLFKAEISQVAFVFSETAFHALLSMQKWFLWVNRPVNGTPSEIPAAGAVQLW